MNRKLKIISLIAWLVLAIILVFILVNSISSKTNLGFNINFNGKELTNMTVQKEDSISLDGCNNIKVNFSSEEIKLVTIDDEDFKVTELSSKDLSDDEKFTMTKNGDTITVQKNNFNTIHFNFFNDSGFREIQLFLPKKYVKALNIETSSGDINIASPLSLSDVDLKVSSGHINCSDNIQTVDKASFKSTSGDIKLNGLSAKESSFNASSGRIKLDGTINSEKNQVKTTSGDININELKSDYNITASSGRIKIQSLLLGSGTIDSTSGDINVNYKGISDHSNIKCSSGSVRATIDKSISFDFEGNCTSGSINSNFGLSYKNKKENEATGKFGDGPYKKISINTTSGDISVKNN